jgi:4-alpha-glucanotransferase
VFICVYLRFLFSMASDYEQALDHASRLWGIEPEYWDIWGRKHVTSEQTRRAILRALGVETASALQIHLAIRERTRKEWSRLLPPALVIGQSKRPRQAPLYIPHANLEDTLRLRIRHEDGQVDVHDFAVADLAETGFEDFEGRRILRRQLPLPEELPPGYYNVDAAVGELRDSMRLIVTPDHAWSPKTRAAGLAVALYGVRSRRNWGCGDFRDLRELADYVGDDLGASFIALNPLHALHNRRPYNISPYLPVSVFYQNFLYLDVEAIAEFRCPAAQKLWTDPAVQAEVEAVRASELVEYERVAALKMRFLRTLFRSFLRERRDGSERAASFKAYVESEGELLDRFATYCALDEWLHARHPEMWIWTQWPEEYRDPDSPATRRFRERHSMRVLFYQYVQWQIDQQLACAQQYCRSNGLAIGLYHDLALATDRFGADLWAHRRFYVSGCRVGSPPDDFSPKGQDWAFPPPCSDHHRETGYRLFTESIRKNCRHGGALRIDHVMRFFRLYWIPDGADATEGAYVRDRWEDLIGILALESVRNQVMIIGEDLGTVEPSVREALARCGILSYRLFYFERDERGAFKPYSEYPAQALVSTTTHDLPTLAGFWKNADIEARRQAGILTDERNYSEQVEGRMREKQKILDVLFALRLLPEHMSRSAAEIPELTGELHNAIIGFLALAPSALLAVNQEDLTKEEAQQNLPGTTFDQYPNWSRKMRFTVEELRTEPEARDFTRMFRRWIGETGRGNAATR